MILRYGVLFTVTVHHDFYADGLCPDLVASPTPACARRLLNHGLIFRARKHGFAVLGELDPAADPPELLRPPDEPLMLAFVLRAKAGYFLNITDLDAGDLEGRVYYLNNLRDDAADGRLHLSDSVDDARLGGPVTLVARGTHRYAAGGSASSINVEAEDLFGNVAFDRSFEFPEPVSELDVDLAGAEGIVSGTYTLSDDLGGAERIYFAPQLFGAEVFAVVEIFDRTDALTPDASNRVPAAYRFLDGSAVTPVHYAIGLEARATTRRYVVTKKYDGGAVELDNLTIQGGTFTKTTATDLATFESNAPVALSEAGEDYDLHHNGTKLLDLPSPGKTTPLQGGAAPGSFTSESYINV